MHELEALYLQYRQDVYRYLLSLTHSAGMAEDLLSETFLQALRMLPTYRGDAPVRSWLFGIARRVWLKSLRRPPDLPLEERAFSALPLASGPEEACLTRAAAGRARQLLAQKDERTQQVVEMRLQGWPFAHIAEEVGVSENSARVIDFRARKWLREMLQKEGLL